MAQEGRAPGGRCLHGGLHPYYFTGVGFCVLWIAFGLVLLPSAVDEIGWKPELLIYVLFPAPGIVGLISFGRTCRVRVDSEGIRRDKRADPPVITWFSVRDVKIDTSDDSFPLLDVPILDELGFARRLEPLVIVEDPRRGLRLVSLEELGRRRSRRGHARLCGTIAELRDSAGLEPEEQPSFDHYRLKRSRRRRQEPTPDDYRPRHAA